MSYDDEEERVKRFQKYEADFKQYLIAKYFSDKTVCGGNIFNIDVSAESETTMASRSPSYQSSLDIESCVTQLDAEVSNGPILDKKSCVTQLDAEVSNGPILDKRPDSSKKLKTESLAPKEVQGPGTSNWKPSTSKR